MSRSLFGSRHTASAPIQFTEVTEEAAAKLREGGQTVQAVVWLLQHTAFPFQEVPVWWEAPPSTGAEGDVALGLVQATGLLAFVSTLEREHGRSFAVETPVTLARVTTMEAVGTRTRIVAIGVARARHSRFRTGPHGRDFFYADLVTLPDVDAGPPPAETRLHGLALGMVDARSLATRLCSQPAVRLLLSDPHALRRRFPSPTQLSYWAAEHLPLGAHQRADLLASPTTTSRLRLLLDFSAKLDSLVCDCCQQHWADASDVLNLQADEGGASYVNRHGYIHSLVTLGKMAPNSVVLTGHPTAEDCWFTGFAWSMLMCARCHSHAGWKYTRAGVDGEGDAQGAIAGGLSEFFGLRVGTFVLRTHAEADA